MMKLVEDSKLAGIRDMFRQASRGENYNLDRYQTCYHRYFGCGQHLYILVNECEEDKIAEVGNQRGVHPREMAKQLSAHVADFRIVTVDVEMGGIGVYGEPSPSEES